MQQCGLQLNPSQSPSAIVHIAAPHGRATLYQAAQPSAPRFSQIMAVCSTLF